MVMNSAPRSWWQRLRHWKYCLDRAFAEYRETVHTHAELSFAQYAEDLLLDRVFSHTPVGFYVDVGAHHPIRHSNTYRLYRRGWRGINIDATPGSMEPFRRLRPRDINLECGIGREEGGAVFHLFNVPQLNTFDAQAAAVAARDPRFREIGSVIVPVRRLDNLLETHLPPGVQPDLLSIDAEGWDLAVLQGNDWQRFRPTWILVECDCPNLEDLPNHPTHRWLGEQGYQARIRGLKTTFYSHLSSSAYQELARRI